MPPQPVRDFRPWGDVGIAPDVGRSGEDGRRVGRRAQADLPGWSRKPLKIMKQIGFFWCLCEISSPRVFLRLKHGW